MKQITKRSLSLFLIVALVLGLLPGSALAASDTIKLTDCDFNGQYYYSDVTVKSPGG